MGKTAFLFSGQGAQHIGMGKDLYENYDCVKELFDECESIRPGTLELMFSGNEEDLKMTQNTQPCLYLADLGAALALKSEGVSADFVAGFSLGEIPALAFAGAYSFIDGFKIACARGEYMAQASQANPSTMAAVLKLSDEKVKELCSKYDSVFPVNFNSEGQVSVAGVSEQLEALKADVQENGGRFMMLNVSGGFHSPFMNSASTLLETKLSEFDIKAPQICAYSNYTAQPYEDNVKELLTKQINNPVNWKQTVISLKENGVDTFIEVGVGITLRKLVTRIVTDVNSYNVEKVTDIEKIVRG